MSDAIPVVCIHGALRSAAGMWPTARYLRGQGLDARAFGYATRSATLEEHGLRLRAFLEQWLGEAQPNVLGFLTHSMGGLVVRAYLDQLESPPQPDTEQRVVMLSPPNQGSILARKQADNPMFRWLYGLAAEQLSAEELSVRPSPPTTAKVLVLAGGTGDAGYNPLIEGDDDGVVALEEMALPGVDPVLVGGVHGLLQWRPSVLARAAAFIRTGVDEPADDEPAPE